MTLIIKRCVITSDLGVIISTCFPNLTRLAFSGRLFGNVDIQLHSHSLTFANFVIRKSGIYDPQNQVDAQHYECSRKQNIRVSSETSRRLPTLTVSCSTKKRLDTSGKNIKLL
jgi:hypothetical protein